jgi:hypothetical protein
MMISPVVAGTRPDIIIISVLLPHPDGPTMETNSPAWISIETSSTALSAPRARDENTLLMPEIRTNGSVLATDNSRFAARWIRILVNSSGVLEIRLNGRLRGRL